MEQAFSIHHKYLNQLGEEELKQLASLMKYKSAGKNEVLIPAGKAVKYVFYVKKGIVRLSFPDKGGKEVNTHLAWDGMFISSYYSLINNRISDESVITITPCELLQFPYEGLVALFDPYPKVERLARILAEEAFVCLAERVRMLQTMAASERYHHLMKTIPAEVFLNIPLQEIASFLGIAPGSLSRIRNEFLHIC